MTYEQLVNQVLDDNVDGAEGRMQVRVREVGMSCGLSMTLFTAFKFKKIHILTAL